MPPSLYQKPFFLTDACEELFIRYTNQFHGRDGKSKEEVLKGHEISSNRFKNYAEICYVILEI